MYVYKLFNALEDEKNVFKLHPKITSKRTERWARRHRKLRPPFFLRNRKSLRSQQHNDKQREKSADTRADNLIDFCDRSCYWKYLHSVGDSYAKTFESLCSINPDLMMMFDLEWKFRIDLNKQRFAQELLFYAGNEMLDLTKLSDVGHAFRFQSVYHSKTLNHIPVVFDSGASISITPERTDFVEFSANVDGTTLTGITSSAICKGKGLIELTVLDDNGSKKYIKTEALYVPEAKVKLLSIQRYCSKVKGGARFSVDSEGCVFEFPRSEGGGKLTFDLESNNMLPQTLTVKQWSRKLIKGKEKSDIKTFTVVATENLNLDSSQKQLLEWHYRLGHFNMNWIRALIRQQILPVRRQNVSIVSCLCEACQLSKQTKRSDGAVKKTIRPEKDGALKKNMTAIGGRISMDQFVSSLPGRLAHTYGKEATEK